MVLGAVFNTFFEIVNEKPFVVVRKTAKTEGIRTLAGGIGGFVMLAYFVVALYFSLEEKPFQQIGIQTGEANFTGEEAKALFQSPLVTLCSQCGYDIPTHNTTETTADDAPEFIPFGQCIALVVEILVISLILPEVTGAQLIDEEEEQKRQQSNWIEKCKTGAETGADRMSHSAFVVTEETANVAAKHARTTSQEGNEAALEATKNARKKSNASTTAPKDEVKADEDAPHRTIIVATHEEIKYIIQGIQHYQLFDQAKRDAPEGETGSEQPAIDATLLKRIERLGILHCFLDFVLPVITNAMQLVALGAGLQAYFQQIGGNRDGQTGNQDVACFLTFMISMAYYKPILQPWIKLSIWAAKGDFRMKRAEWVAYKAMEKAKKNEPCAETISPRPPVAPPPLVQIAEGMILIFIPLILLPVAMYGANYLTGDRTFGGDEYFAVSQWIMWFLNDMWSWGDINFAVSLEEIFSFDYSFNFPSEIAISLSSLALLIDLFNGAMIKNLVLFAILYLLQTIPASITRPVTAFVKLDEDHSGTITKEELKASASRMGYKGRMGNTTSEQDSAIDKLFEKIDEDHSTDIDFVEFVYYVVAHQTAVTFDSLENTLAAVFEAEKQTSQAWGWSEAVRIAKAVGAIKDAFMASIKKKKSSNHLDNFTAERKEEIENKQVDYMVKLAMAAYGVYIVFLVCMCIPTIFLFFPTMLLFFSATAIWLFVFTTVVLGVTSLLVVLWGQNMKLVREFAGVSIARMYGKIVIRFYELFNKCFKCFRCKRRWLPPAWTTCPDCKKPFSECECKGTSLFSTGLPAVPRCKSTCR
jgi:hypothetical protein